MKENTIFETCTKNPLAILFYILAAIVLFVTIILLADTGDGLFALLFIAVPVLAVMGILIQSSICYLTITNVRITAQRRFFGNDGKRVELPVKKITAIGCGRLNRLSAATAHGGIHLFFVVDRNKAFTALSDLLAANHFSSGAVSASPEPSVEVFDDLPEL